VFWLFPTAVAFPVGWRLALVLLGVNMIRRRPNTRCYRAGRVGSGRRRGCRAPARAVEPLCVPGASPALV